MYSTLYLSQDSSVKSVIQEDRSNFGRLKHASSNVRYLGTTEQKNMTQCK